MSGKAHVIVVGNTKGGSGKSTVAMHLVVSLLRGGVTVGTVDLDGQGTLTRYVENRRRYAERHGAALPLPEHAAIAPDIHGDARHDAERLADVVGPLRERCDTLVIDTPGTDHLLTRAGHGWADTLITPMNDSFVDLDVLARVDADSMTITGPSHYAAMVWEIKKQRAMRDGGSMAWIVLRNRLSHVGARNKQDMERLLAELSRRIGFHLIRGLGERVIYRELFLAGLTLLDLKTAGVSVEMSMSHVAARNELRQLLDAIGEAHARTMRAA